MKEPTLFVSWGQVPRGREDKAYEIFAKAHEFLKKKKQEGKIKELRIYFNSQSADLAGFLLMTGDPGFLMAGSEELEKFYMQAAAVVDDLSLKMMVGGEEQEVMHQLDRWLDVQKSLGFAQA
jgi:hypothetical protein